MPSNWDYYDEDYEYYDGDVELERARRSLQAGLLPLPAEHPRRAQPAGVEHRPDRQARPQGQTAGRRDGAGFGQAAGRA